MWFWKPQPYWHGWRTLIPAFIGHDEFGYETLALGWTFTGRVIIRLRKCHDQDCHH